MAFHVEIRRGRQRARAFNLDEGRLLRAVLEPWVAGRRVALGDREWEPRESRLAVLEGPELTGADLAHGQGWNNAERTAQDVTARVLAATDAPPVRAAVALLAETDAAAAVLEDLLRRLSLEPVDGLSVLRLERDSEVVRRLRAPARGPA